MQNQPNWNGEWQPLQRRVALDGDKAADGGSWLKDAAYCESVRRLVSTVRPHALVADGCS